MSDPVFSDLVGKTLTTFNVVSNYGDDRIYIETDAGDEFMLWHSQDCCESVNIEDISGDLSDLIETPILVAEERTSIDRDESREDINQCPGDFLWTFYTLRTIKGTVDIRWFGSSEMYSVSVSFDRR